MPKPILILMAMEAEAAPVARALGMGADEPLHPSLPSRLKSGMFNDTPIFLVTNGRDARFGVDAIGSVSAAISAWTASLRVSPRLVINAGTAGGFARHGAAVGDVYLSNGEVMFHDRRIPLGDFAPYGIGSFPCMDATAIASKLGLKLGRLTTGDSLDLCDADARMIEQSGATVKDMEAAAIASVAGLLNVSFLGVKSITDLVDAPHPTADQFIQNLDHAVERLAFMMPPIVGEVLKERA